MARYKKYYMLATLFLLAACIKKNSIQDITPPYDDQMIVEIEPSSPDQNQDDVTVQFISEMISDGIIMLATQAGVSLANQSIGNQRRQIIEQIGKNNQIIENKMQSFQHQIQQNQQTELQTITTAFGNAQQNIQAQTTKAQTIADLELEYIDKNISMNKPQQNYIFNQIQFDQIFALGTMLTPQGAVWKNPFSVGDWEYEKTDNSFWQYEIAPIFISSTDDTNAPTTSSLKAENNAIFTEYYTARASYTIAGKITLYNVQPPFFAGIIFNKSRWISGDFEAIRKCRMMGIYGQAKGDIGIYFTQQYTMTDAQMKASGQTSPIQTPLQQIINGGAQPKIKLPADTCSNIAQTPVVITFAITNSALKVELKISVNNNPATTVSINNLDPSIYMYHGIGFISPGAIAQFTLTEPTDLLFNQEALAAYKE